MNEPKTSTAEILVHLVRPGVGAGAYHLSEGATLADLLRLSGASTTDRDVFLGDVLLTEGVPLHNGAVVAIVARPGNSRGSLAAVDKTPGVCGGDARIAGTRIPVWQLVEARNQGVWEAQLLIDFPRLTAQNLEDAWDYADDHPAEIAAAIHDNEVA